MLSREQEEALVRAIYSIESLNGCIVGYHGGNMSKVLSSGYAGTINFGRTVVVIEEAPPAPSERLIIAATNRSGGLEATRPAEDVTNRGRVGRELVGTGLSCGVAVVTGLSAVGGVIGAPATGGSSLGLTVLAWTGFLTSAAQCAYGIARLNEIRTNPGDDSLSRLDSDPDVQRAVNIVDFLGLASGVATIGVRGVRFLAVRGMSRAERIAVITQELTELQKTEAGRRTLEAALREAGATARDLERILPRGLNHGGTIRVASAAASAISAPHAKALTEAIRDGLIGIAISATPSSYTGSASGVVNTLIVNVINK
jgi:hypothetical protein